MTWEELCEKAKEMGYVLDKVEQELRLSNDNYAFWKDGTVQVYITPEDYYYSDYYSIAWDKTPDQMWQIMEALR